MSPNTNRFITTLSVFSVMGCAAWLAHTTVQGRLVPSAQISGNQVLLSTLHNALQEYFADFQHWPKGSGERVFFELNGDIILQNGEHFPVPPYYQKGHAIATAGQILLDAWRTPLVFEFPPDGMGPAVVISPGPDRAKGTADDQSITVAPVPQQMGPPLRLYLRSKLQLDVRDDDE